MRPKAPISLALITGTCTVAAAQTVVVDLDGVGATDVTARAHFDEDADYLPLPSDAWTFLSTFQADDPASLRVGHNAPGHVHLHDVGRLFLGAEIGAGIGGNGRMTVSGESVLSQPEYDGRDPYALIIGGDGVGELTVESGASIEPYRDDDGYLESPIRVGVRQSGALHVRSGASVRHLPGYGGNELSFELGAAFELGFGGYNPLPIDGRSASLTAEGVGTEVRVGWMRTGGAMNADITIADGARFIVDKELILGSDFGDGVRGTLHAGLTINNAEAIVEERLLLCSNQNASVTVTNGARLTVGTPDRPDKIEIGDGAGSPEDVLAGELTVRGVGSEVSVQRISVEADAIGTIRVLDGGAVYADFVFGRPNLGLGNWTLRSVEVAGDGSSMKGLSMPKVFLRWVQDFRLGAGAHVSADLELLAYVDSAGTTLRLEIDARDVNAEARLLVNAVAADTCVIELAPGFMPSDGDRFDLIDSDVESAFGSVVTPALPTGLAWDLSRFESEGIATVAERCSPADLVPPFGITDLNDIDAFIPLFLAADPGADFVPPAGIVDLDDLDAFIFAFLAGCP